MTFFHGKGGTVGRGGNPALFRAVLAHPPSTINGRFRVTEQGEMITQNFGSTGMCYTSTIICILLLYMCMYVCMYVYYYICVYMYLYYYYICKRMYVNVCMYMYVYIHCICTYIMYIILNYMHLSLSLYHTIDLF